MIVGTSVSALPSGSVVAERTKNLSEAHYPSAAKVEGWAADATLEVRSNARALLEQLGKSQANEGMWGMPGHIEAMKAAVSCDKLGGAAHTH